MPTRGRKRSQKVNPAWECVGEIEGSSFISEHPVNSCWWSHCWSFQVFDRAKQQHLQLLCAWTLWNGSPLCISWPWHKVFWLHKCGKFYFLATSWGIYQSNRLAAQPRSLLICKMQIDSIIADLFQALASSQKEPFFLTRRPVLFSRCGLFCEDSLRHHALTWISSGCLQTRREASNRCTSMDLSVSASPGRDCWPARHVWPAATSASTLKPPI